MFNVKSCVSAAAVMLKLTRLFMLLVFDIKAYNTLILITGMHGLILIESLTERSFCEVSC